jgi:ribonuclease HII
MAHEAALHRRGWHRVAGLDEAGRGCLAGPVVAAAVVLPPEADLPGVRDSKQLQPAQREVLFDAIHMQAVAVGVGVCTPGEIDRMNILQAALEAMRRAVLHLPVAPEYLLIDGNQRLPNALWPQETLVRGDAHSLSIAAASILAKVTRDRIMQALHDEHPAYGWHRNKGYPTPDHYAALAAHGPSVYHRRSFRLERA